ncbi:hypothetical protein EI94DRAFT_1658585 [Lactarius quietus]|nr:hypothetical protein EI94DRAFT_1658585 [Lactarius quietus]
MQSSDLSVVLAFGCKTSINPSPFGVQTMPSYSHSVCCTLSISLLATHLWTLSLYHSTRWSALQHRYLLPFSHGSLSTHVSTDINFLRCVLSSLVFVSLPMEITTSRLGASSSLSLAPSWLLSKRWQLTKFRRRRPLRGQSKHNPGHTAFIRRSEFLRYPWHLCLDFAATTSSCTPLTSSHASLDLRLYSVLSMLTSLERSTMCDSCLRDPLMQRGRSFSSLAMVSSLML